MTILAELILHGIGGRRFLRVPHDGTAASLVDYESHELTEALERRNIPARQLACPIGPLDAGAVAELLAVRGLLCKLERVRINQRYGWSDFRGLDGENADFYACCQ